jgi:transcriptional regulator with XRE-family HTH domain
MSDLVRFGQIVRARRIELGLTQAKVTANGGPSDRRQTRIERGYGPAPSVDTLDKVDRGLQWAPGSAAAVLRGADPTPVDEVSYSAEDVQRRVALEVALDRAGVRQVAARDHTPRANDDYRLAPEVVDQLISLLNSLPPSARS